MGVDSTNECIRALQTLIEKVKASRGESAYLGDLYAAMALMLADSGDSTAAESALAKCIDIRSRACGQDAIIVGQTLQLLAELQEAAGNWSQAEKSLMRALEISIRRHGKNSADAQRLIERLRAVVGEQGRDLDEANRFAAGVAITSMNDAMDVFPWDMYFEQGKSFLQVRNYREAERSFNYLRDVAMAVSPNSTHQAQCFEMLAETYWAQERHDDAFRLREKALNIYESILGADHLSIGRFLVRNLEMRMKLEQLEQAKAIALRAIVVLASHLGEQHEEVIALSDRLHEIESKLSPQGVRATVEFAKRRLQRMRDRRPAVLAALENNNGSGATVPQNESAHAVQGADAEETEWIALMEKGKAARSALDHAEAERILIECVELAEKFASKDKRLWDTMLELAGAYNATGKLYKAMSTYQNVLKRCEQTCGPENPNIVKYLVAFAENQAQQGDLWKAQECYERVVRIYVDACAPQAMIQPYQQRLDELQANLESA